MFPENWTQVWLQWPGNGINTSQWGLFWFQYFPRIDLSTFSLPIFQTDLSAWLAAIAYATYSASDLTDPATVKYYINGSGPLIIGSFLLFTWPVDAEVTPSATSVVIQRLTTGIGRRQRGRIYLPGPLFDHIDGNLLNATGRAVYQNVANNMATPFISQGIGFFPALTSYANGDLEILNTCKANVRLGKVLRRQRFQTDYGYFFPKPPPS